MEPVIPWNINAEWALNLKERTPLFVQQTVTGVNRILHVIVSAHKFVCIKYILNKNDQLLVVQNKIGLWMRSKQSYSGDKTSVLILGKLQEAMFSIEIIIIILFPMKIIIFAAILCPEPPAIKNMNVKHVNTTDNVYHFGNIVTYECIDGYRMFGNNVLRCLANGRWTRMQGKCTSMC